MSDITNLISAIFTEGCNSVIADGKLYQYDYGQYLKFEGLDLPDAYEVHFSDTLRDDGTAKTQIGTTTEEGVSSVLIPDEYLTTGKYVYAFIYLHSTEDDGETEYVVTIPVQKRPAINPTPVTPEEQSVITQAIAALQDAISETEDNVQQTRENVTLAEQFADLSELHSEDAEAWSVGKRSGVDVEQDDETFNNNAKYYAQMAEQSASESGYISFYIDDDGYLHYVKTPYVNLDFYIDSDGYLCVTTGD